MAFSGDKVRELREKAGMDRRQLAELVGTTMQYISHLENGVKTNPAFDLVERLAEALGVTCSEFRAVPPASVPEVPTTTPQAKKPAPKKKGK